MASLNNFIAILFAFASIFQLTLATRHLAGRQEIPNQMQIMFRYHNGPLLSGNVSINLIWYGKFKPSQRAIVSDFITSLSSTTKAKPSVHSWKEMIDKYYRLAGYTKKGSRRSSLALSLGARQILDENYSLGKSLDDLHIKALATKVGRKDSISIVLTSSDVAVRGFCSSRCGTHGSSKTTKHGDFTYIWVGNSETQCPGQCAWPFHQPIYGPQDPPLVAPNNDVGLDGMVINLASLLSGTVTNPFMNGYFQGSKDVPLEAASACPGVFGKGAYPGYAGNLLKDKTTGASYNAHGINGRRYLLPALMDPSTSICSTLV